MGPRRRRGRYCRLIQMEAAGGRETGETGMRPVGVSRRIALYGPLLLALYFVATTRWGSFLLPGPPISAISRWRA